MLLSFVNIFLTILIHFFPGEFHNTATTSKVIVSLEVKIIPTLKNNPTLLNILKIILYVYIKLGSFLRYCQG